MSDFATVQDYVKTGDPNIRVAKYGDDSGLFVEFSREPKLMVF